MTGSFLFRVPKGGKPSICALALAGMGPRTEGAALLVGSLFGRLTRTTERCRQNVGSINVVGYNATYMFFVFCFLKTVRLLVGEKVVEGEVQVDGRHFQGERVGKVGRLKWDSLGSSSSRSCG